MTTVIREDLTLKMPVFHINGKEDPEEHWFVCEAISSVKQTTDDHMKITMLETISKDCALVW